jgi:SAM-dependent methyltransferase
MNEKNFIIYKFLNKTYFYLFIQKIMGGKTAREKIIKNNQIKKNCNILDIGCGPAYVLDFLKKKSLKYFGYDTELNHIEYAKKKFLNKNHHFFCKKFNELELNKLPKFDYVFLFGIIHHLNNAELKKIIFLIKKVLKKNGKLLILDNVLINKQNIIARILIKLDKGNHIRNLSDYEVLLKDNFKNFNYSIINQKFVPYTWFEAICGK